VTAAASTAVDTAELRKTRGAFFTPEPIARYVAEWAVRSMGDRVLEPSCGEAAFLLAAVDRLAQLPGADPAPGTVGALDGVELHSGSAAAAERVLRRAGVHARVAVGDFFLVEPTGSYDVVIGNPPYVRYQDFTGEARTRSRAVALRAGVSLTNLASSWAAFRVHSALFLKPGGRMGLVLPGELLSVNYAAEVRAFLLREFARVDLVVLTERVFPGVLEEVVLLLADGYRHGPASHAEIVEARNAADLATAPVGRAWRPGRTQDKWTPSLLPAGAPRVANRRARAAHCAAGCSRRHRRRTEDERPLMASSGGKDSFTPYDELLAAPLTDPWTHGTGEPLRYVPDYDLLGRLLTIPVAADAMSESGSFANGIDAWIAQELRRAGFGADEVWPRPTRPRVLPRDLAVLLDKLPTTQRTDLARRFTNMAAVAPVDARVLGRAYEKQVDVVIARWDRGPEVLISTKAQLSSFGKNLPNRFEESYGDAGNLCGRYPLAAVGYFFVQRATIRTTEPDAFERSVDMIRKLRNIGDSNGYTATSLLLVDWELTGGQASVVRARPDLVPDDIAPPQFFTAMIDRVLATTPVTFHVAVRERREQRRIAVIDEDSEE